MMNDLFELIIRNCPLRQLPFKKIEVERETCRALNKWESCMFGLEELSLECTEISEVIFPEGVCPNLRTLELCACKKLTQIGGLSGLTKLQQFGINWCESVEKLPNIERLISLEKLHAMGCTKLQSIPGLGQLGEA